MKKRVLAALLSLVMCLSCLPAGAAATEYPDMPTGWSREAMEAAVENGLFRGDDLGRLNPQGLLTRAQMAAVVVRAFGAITPKDLTSYQDMEPNQWYYEDVAKAAHMGIMQGEGNRMAPGRSITRQEAFTVLARALRLADGEGAALEVFSDAGKVADWAAGAVAAMVSAGYVGGSHGALNPTGNITREEFAQVMFNIFGTYYTQAGTYTDSPARSVMVNSPDVTLKGIKVAGDIIVGDGVGDGDVTLDHVTLEGRLVVRGGGVNSVHIIGDEQAWFVVVAKVDGNVRVVADEGTKIETLTVEDGSNDIIIEGNVSTVSIETEGTTVILKDAKIDKLNVVAANTEVSMTGKTEVNYLSVTEVAAGTKVEAEKGVTISNVLADTDLTLKGEAKVEKIEGNGAVTDAAGEPVKENPAQTPSYTPTYTPPQPSHEHTWVDGEVLRAPSCFRDGEMSQTCSVCGATQTVAIGARCPDEEIIPGTPATCTAPGRSDGSKCSVCGAMLSPQITLSARGHNWGEGEVTTPATCTATGTKTYHCLNEDCTEVKTETIPTADHDWQEPTVSESEGCHAEITTYTCSVCHDTKIYSSEGEDVHHTPGEPVSESEITATCLIPGSHDLVTYCTECGAEIDRVGVIDGIGEHVPVIDEAVPATCTVSGLTEGSHCSVCTTIIRMQVLTNPLNHAWSETGTTTDATCTENGHTIYSCTRDGCEDTLTVTIFAPGHTEVTDPAVPATCTEVGKTEGKHCSVCNEVLTAQTDIPALNHDFAAAWTSDGTKHWHVCSRCDEKGSEAAHTGTAIGEAKDPTCGAPGQTAGSKCSVCEKVLEPQAIRPATGEHSYGDWENADANNHKHTCSVCGDVKTEAHTPGEWVVTVPATETAAGTKVKKCTVCQAVVATETIPATGGTSTPTPEEDISEGEKPVSNVRFGESQWFGTALTWDAPSGVAVYQIEARKSDGTWSSPSRTSNTQITVESFSAGTYNRVRITSLSGHPSSGTVTEDMILGKYETDIALTVNEVTEIRSNVTVKYTDTNETNFGFYVDGFYNYGYVFAGLEPNCEYSYLCSVVGEVGGRSSTFTTDASGRWIPSSWDAYEEPVTNWDQLRFTIFEQTFEIDPSNSKQCVFTTKTVAQNLPCPKAESVPVVSNITLSQWYGLNDGILVQWDVPANIDNISEYRLFVSSNGGATWFSPTGHRFAHGGDTSEAGFNSGPMPAGTYQVKIVSVASPDSGLNNDSALSDWTITVTDDENLDNSTDVYSRTTEDYNILFGDLRGSQKNEQYGILISTENGYPKRAAAYGYGLTNYGDDPTLTGFDYPVTVSPNISTEVETFLTGQGYYLLRRIEAPVINTEAKTLQITFHSWSSWKSLTLTDN